MKQGKPSFPDLPQLQNFRAVTGLFGRNFPEHYRKAQAFQDKLAGIEPVATNKIERYNHEYQSKTRHSATSGRSRA